MCKFDAIIIGFGKGGKTLASDLAGRGWKVAVVERSEKMYGGTCINIGCIPTKALVRDAKTAAGKESSSFSERQMDYIKAIDRKTAVVEALRKKNHDLLENNPNITIYNGEGSFLSPDTVEVRGSGNEKTVLSAPKVFINTGAETILPPIAGTGGNPLVFTSTSLMNLKSLPQRLVIVGGGYIGLEFASMYASFGSKVTVLEYGPTLLPREDRDMVQSIQESLEKKGITFLFNAAVSGIKNEGTKAVIEYSRSVAMDENSGKQQLVEGEAVLLATGRRPASASLNLAAAGVETDERGNIRVDGNLVTTNPSIYALGDVKGGLQFTYISLDDYRIIINHLFGDQGRSVQDRFPVVYSMFIDPPFSRIGMSESDAQKANLNYSVKTLPVASIPRAKTLGESDGLLKSIVENETGKILGCALFCPESSEIINIVSLAMKNGITADGLRNFVFTHPSMSEALNDLF